MAEARLRIRAEGSEIARAMGQIAGVTRQASAAMNTEERQSSRERTAIQREEMRQHGMMERLRYSETQKALRDGTRAVEAATRERQRAEAQAAQAATTEERARTTVAAREARERERIAEREMSATARAQSNLTRQLAREERQRASSSRATWRQIGQFAVGAGRVALGGISSSLDMVQDARVRRAGSEHSLNAAIYQAGGGQAEVAGIQSAVTQAVTTGNLRGLSRNDVTDTLLAGQTEFNVLGSRGDSPTRRAANLQQALGTIALARNTYQDPHEMLRMQGLLQNRGIQGPMLQQGMMGFSSIAQHGSAEVRELFSQGSGALQRRMQQARDLEIRRNPQATQEQLARVQLQEGFQAASEIEVGKAQGWSVQRAGNVAAGFTSRLQQSVTQDRIYNRLVQEGHQDVATQLFGAHAVGGHHVLGEQYRTITGLAGGLLSAHLDPLAAQNIFAPGGGHGRAQAAQANERQLLGMYMSQAGPISDIVRNAGDFGEKDRARGEQMVNAETQTDLVATEEQRLSALMTNTQVLQEVNHNLQQFNAAHPFVSAVLGELPGGRAAQLVAANAPHVLAQGEISRQASERQERLQGGKFWQTGDDNESENHAQIQALVAGGGRINQTKIRDAGKDALTASQIVASISQAINAGLAAAHITATVAPADAVHAQTVASTNATTNPAPPRRN